MKAREETHRDVVLIVIRESLAKLQAAARIVNSDRDFWHEQSIGLVQSAIEDLGAVNAAIRDGQHERKREARR